jgi:hypothetical protein
MIADRDERGGSGYVLGGYSTMRYALLAWPRVTGFCLRGMFAEVNGGCVCWMGPD